MYATAIEAGDFIWLVGSLCRISRIPFDSGLLVRRYPAPHSARQFLEAIQSLGFRTGESTLDARRLPLPAIAFLKGEVRRPALLVEQDGETIRYVAAGSRSPAAAPLAELDAVFEPAVILARRSEAREPARDGAEAPARFGFRWFWPELLKHRPIWRDVLAASLFIQLIGLAMPLFTQVLIDKVVVHRTSSTLVAVAVGLAMFTVFNAALGWLRQYLLIHTGNRVDAVLGSRVFRHLLRLCLPYFEHRSTGVLVARVHAVETIRDFLAGAAVALLLDLPFLAVFLAVMFAYSWQLTLVAVGFLGLIAALGLAAAPAFRARLNRQFLLGARNQAFLTEHVAGIETVKSLQMEPRLEERYDEMLAQYLASGFATRALANTYNVAAIALEQAMTVAILCGGALLVMRNDGFTIGMLVAFQMFAARMGQPMLRLAGLWQEFQQVNVAVRRLGDIMDAPAEPHALTPSRSGEGRGEIRISGLAFRYGPERPFLFRGLHLAIRPGRLTVLSGQSGCGKSTLARLLLGFYVPTEGSIAIDGRDIRTLSANELRHYFGVVPQETCLFSGSIYENLAAANPNASFADVVQAAKIAEVHDVIESLPRGYETEIGEHGVGLSGGQKQRLAIARAVLKRPRVLVFDEAASSLDPATAEQLAQTVNHLKGRVTVIFIAHQIPRGLQVDEVVRLGEEAGKVRVVGEGRA